MKNQKLTYHLLPTDEASPLHLYNGKLRVVLEHEKSFSKDYLLQAKPQYLYLCSDLPIKEGDWYINLLDNKIWKAERDHKNTGGIIGSKLKKIEFTTDPKLWDIRMTDIILGKAENIGVPAIDGNTKVIVDGVTLDKISVPFFPEFVARYNQKSNEKGFDVEKLAYSECIKQTGTDNPKWKSGFIAGYQSNAGGFSSEDMRDLAWKMVSVPRSSDTKEIDDMITEFIQSIQSKSKSELVIEVEMEVPMHAHVVGNYPDPVIKLDSNGQPTLILK